MPANTRNENLSTLDNKRKDEIRKTAFTELDKFIQSEFLVQDRTSGELKKFRYNFAQRYASSYIKHLSKEREPLRAFVLKSRQVGMTTWTSARMAARAWASNARRCVVVAHRDDRAREILDKCKNFLDQMDPDLKLDYDRQGKDQLRFAATRSSITVATARQIQKVRGDTVRDAIESEAALYDHFGIVHAEIESVVPPNSTDTSIIIETTGFNFNGDAHKFWQQTRRLPRPGKPGRRGKNRYVGIFVPWLEDPECRLDLRRYSHKEIDKLVAEAAEYDENLVRKAKEFDWDAGQTVWAYHTLRNVLHGNWEKFCEDFPCDEYEAWQSKSITYFGKSTLAHFKPDAYNSRVYTFEGRNYHDSFTTVNALKPVASLDTNGSTPYLRVWEGCMPNLNSTYVIAADVAGGETDQGAFSSAFVIDVATREMCAEFHGRLRPDEFAYVLSSLGNMYNTCIIAPEYNNHGVALCQELTKIYFNVYRWRHFDSYKPKMTNKVGWQTNSISRPYMLDVFKRLCEEISRGVLIDPGIIKSPELLGEMRTFADKDMDGSPKALNGCFDDRVMAIAIAHVVASQETHGGQYDISKLISNKIEDWREKALNAGREEDSWGRHTSPLQVIQHLTNYKRSEEEMTTTERNAQQWIEGFFRRNNNNG